MISQKQKEKISIETIKTLVKRFELFPEDASNNRNAPFHEAFLKAFADKFRDKVPDVPFFVSLSSWLHGLNTSLGQSFFENVAHILSDGEKREYTSKKLGNLKITKKQKETANAIITKLSNSEIKPNLNVENSKLLKQYDGPMENALDFSADVFIEEKDLIIAIELKTVKPNSGEMRGEKQKILEGKVAFFNKYPTKKIEFYLGFPFDPTNNSEDSSGYNKSRFMKSCINMSKYFANEEIKIANELWDFLSGEDNTMDQLLKIVNKISTTEFKKKFDLLNTTENRLTKEYSNILEEWNLFSEKKLVDNDKVIKEKIRNNKQLTRTYNQSPFKNGVYNHNRYSRLIEIF